MVESSQSGIIGIAKETLNPWERRVAFTPTEVKILVEQHRMRVIVQPSSNRAFVDKEYAEAGATIEEDLSSADVILGIKPQKIPDLIPDKTYLMYTRVHTGIG